MHYSEITSFNSNKTLATLFTHGRSLMLLSQRFGLCGNSSSSGDRRPMLSPGKLDSNHFLFDGERLFSFSCS